jgi:hypothetical protein
MPRGCTLGHGAKKGTGRNSDRDRDDGIVKLQLGFKFTCAGVSPHQLRTARLIIILVIVLLAWSFRGVPIISVFTGAV